MLRRWLSRAGADRQSRAIGFMDGAACNWGCADQAGLFTQTPSAVTGGSVKRYGIIRIDALRARPRFEQLRELRPAETMRSPSVDTESAERGYDAAGRATR